MGKEQSHLAAGPQQGLELADGAGKVLGEVQRLDGDDRVEGCSREAEGIHGPDLEPEPMRARLGLWLCRQHAARSQCLLELLTLLLKDNR